jgi:DNA-binding transcriptional MerR regulator
MVQIPDNRRYFRIGEASRIVGVEPYVLRYWENEFPQLRPQRADSRQRTYQRKDLETLLEIKRLLYEERMTIEGAKLRLKKEKDEPLNVVGHPFFKEIKGELHKILEVLR